MLKNIENIKSLVKYLFPYKYKLIIGLFILFLSAYLELINPKLFREIIDELNSSAINLNAIYTYLLLVVGIIVLKGIFIFYSRYILISLSRRVEYDIRGKLFRHILTLPPSFFEKHKIGDIISRLTSDIDQVRMVFGPGVMYMFNVVFLVVLALKDMYLIDIALSVYVIIPLILLVYLIWSIGKRYYSSSRLIQEELSRMSNFVNENLEGIRVIKSFVKEELIKRSFNKINRDFIKQNMGLARLSGVFRPTLYFVAGSTSVIILLFGGLKVYRGELSLGYLVEFLRYIEILAIPLMAFGWVMTLYQRGFAAYDRLKSFLLTDPQAQGVKEKVNVNRLGGLSSSDSIAKIDKIDIDSIKFKSLRFAYPNTNTFALDGISFNVKKGERVGIIGPTGSGKSTLVSLLLRIYDIGLSSSIKLNDNSIYDYPLNVLRRSFGYAPQNNFIFPYTISENIRFGSNISDADIIKLARIVELDEDIMLFPNKYNEYVGERGVSLSGGQKQRLGIARALCGGSSVLIFDDSFSAIDSRTERKILSNIRDNFKEKTILIIANRLSTLENVDRVIVIEGGKVIEDGAPDILSRDASSYYYSLIKLEQFSKEFN